MEDRPPPPLGKGTPKCTGKPGKAAATPLVDAGVPAAEGWQDLVFAWERRQFTASLDRREPILTAELPAMLPIPADARGLDIAYRQGGKSIPTVELGPVPGLVIDDPVIGRPGADNEGGTARGQIDWKPGETKGARPRLRTPSSCVPVA